MCISRIKATPTTLTGDIRNLSLDADLLGLALRHIFGLVELYTT